MQEIRVGDWVEVRPLGKIAATLDATGSLDGLPFMPEMLPFVGRTFRVAQQAERTCIHPPQIPLPRLGDAVVLRALRCDGEAHGGCELGCMLFWRTAWLRRVDGPAGGHPPVDVPAPTSQPPAANPAPLELPVHQPGSAELFRCQGTELPRATTAGPPLWAPGQYVQFLRDGTYTPLELGALFGRIATRIVARKVAAGKVAAGKVAAGKVAAGKTSPPSPGPGDRDGAADLQPGEWVRVKIRPEIQSTLDASGKLNGLAFGGDMAVDCGKTLQVQKRVRRILDEQTGRIREVKDTVLLKDSVCDRYLGCARGMPILWREAWLERVEDRAGAPRQS